MKKLFIALLGVTFFSPLCFAQEASTPASPVALNTAETKTLTGKVCSVFLGGSMMSFGAFGKKGNRKGNGKENKKEKSKGKNSESITVTDEKGEAQVFRVKADSLITAKNGKALELKEIREGDTVTVAYITSAKKGTQEATAIKLVEPRSMLLRIKDSVGDFSFIRSR